MSIITKPVQDRLHAAKTEVFFVSGQAAKWWNARRADRKSEICLLSGYYWAAEEREAGPFRTPSAAWRDVYYREVLGELPPSMDQRELAYAEAEIAEIAEIAEKAHRNRRRRRTKQRVRVREQAIA